MQPGNGLWFLNSHVDIQLAAADSADGLSVMLFHEPLNSAPPLHVHRAEDEAFHLLEGEVRFLIGGTTSVGVAGQTVLAPRGVPHGLRVVSNGARFLVITTGGHFERMVRAMARPAVIDGLPEFVTPGPEVRAKLAAQCALERIDILGPPIA